MIRNILLVFCVIFTSFLSNGQAVFYFRCADADNLALIEQFTIQSNSKKMVVGPVANGIVKVSGFEKGSEVLVKANYYLDHIYQRFSGKKRIAEKYNAKYKGTKLPESGDTITIELQLEEQWLQERWKLEDILFSYRDTTDLPEKVDSEPVLVDEEAFVTMLSSMIHFPAFLVNEGIEGKVVLSAVVEKDGTLSSIEVKRGIEKHLDRIALRALRNTSLPKVKPAMKDGVPVRRKIIFPVNFNLK